MGIKLKKEWLATLDGRTRHEHRILDGQKVDTDKPFKVGGKEIMYPGDPTAPAHLVYNCRCTLIAALDGADEVETAHRRDKDGVGRDMTYEEWERSRKRDGLSSGKVGDSDGYTTINRVEDFDFSDEMQRNNEIRAFAKRIAYNNDEHALVISPLGKLYELKGTDVNVNTELCGADALRGAITLHNHPLDNPNNAFYDSFSREDFTFATKYSTGIQYLVSGELHNAFEITKTMTEDEASDLYYSARFSVWNEAYEIGREIEHEQLEIMRRIAQMDERVKFYENF